MVPMLSSVCASAVDVSTIYTARFCSSSNDLSGEGKVDNPRTVAIAVCGTPLSSRALCTTCALEIESCMLLSISAAFSSAASFSAVACACCSAARRALRASSGCGNCFRLVFHHGRSTFLRAASSSKLIG